MGRRAPLRLLRALLVTATVVALAGDGLAEPRRVESRRALDGEPIVPSVPRAPAGPAAPLKGSPMTNTTSAARLLKGAIALSAAAVLTTLGAAPASAHVTADATSTAAGGWTQVTFSVPNESDTASTDRLELRLPADTPFASVRTKPVEGWTAEVTEEELPTPVTVGEGAITEAASTVTWTADDEHVIDPGEFQAFTVSVGPLPAEGTTLLLPVAQSYTDGRTVDWDEPTAEGREEPAHPAPSLTVTAAEGGADSHGGATAAAEEASATEDSSAALGWAGLIAGLLGLAAGVVALVRTRRRG